MSEPKLINEKTPYVEAETDTIYNLIECYYDMKFIRENKLIEMFKIEDNRMILKFEKRSEPLSDEEINRKYGR
jgi:hypothetical protein